MRIGDEMYVLVAEDGEVYNCWTSPNRLYATKGPVTRILNDLIRAAEYELLHGDRWDRPKDIKLKAKARMAHIEELKRLKVKKVVIAPI